MYVNNMSCLLKYRPTPCLPTCVHVFMTIHVFMTKLEYIWKAIFNTEMSYTCCMHVIYHVTCNMHVVANGSLAITATIQQVQSLKVVDCHQLLHEHLGFMS